MFLKRSYSPEIMDDFSIQDERIDTALNELKNANRFLGGISTTRAGLNLLIKSNRKNGEHKPGENISILDVGSGASDNLLFIKNKLPFIKIKGLDLNKRACKYLGNSSGLDIICADTLKIPVKNNKFDIVHSSLFLHHFDEEEIKQILKNFLEISKLGIIINDLRRSVLALAGINLIAFLFSRSEMFKNDGPLSVRRGFLKKDLLDILKRLGIKNFTLKRKWAFRWMLVIYKNE
jgi:hypothetical protein